MGYESLYERFLTAAPSGRRVQVEFQKAGMLSAGDNPELYFFRVDSEQAVVAISGSALKAFQQHRYLTREEKIDLAGLWLKKAIEGGRALSAENLHIHVAELNLLASELALPGVRME